MQIGKMTREAFKKRNRFALTFSPLFRTGVSPCSNGSGKSSLAMAALWALTGTLDPRPMQDAKVTDVVNDESKVRRLIR